MNLKYAHGLFRDGFRYVAHAYALLFLLKNKLYNYFIRFILSGWFWTHIIMNERYAKFETMLLCTFYCVFDVHFKYLWLTAASYLLQILLWFYKRKKMIRPKMSRRYTLAWLTNRLKDSQFIYKFILWYIFFWQEFIYWKAYFKFVLKRTFTIRSGIYEFILSLFFFFKGF